MPIVTIKESKKQELKRAELFEKLTAAAKQAVADINAAQDQFYTIKVLAESEGYEINEETGELC